MPDPNLETHLREEGNRAVASACAVTAVLGTLGALGIVGALAVGGPAELQLALFASAWGALSSVGMWALARGRLLHGPLAYAAFAVYASLPTLLSLAAHLRLDTGAATFLTGPMSYLYPVLIVLSGCLLRPGLPVFVGAFTAASFYACHELGRPMLVDQFPGDDVFSREFTDRFVWVNRAMMLTFTGLVTAVLTTVARRLATSVRAEAVERDRIRRAFGRYVSDEVASHVLSGADARGGHRTTVVVLFTDLRGFTSFSETAEPEVLVRRLNQYFDAMVSAIEGRGGVVDKFIGDAVMAVFGGVLPLEHPEDRAVEAAIAMRSALAALNDRWASEGLGPWEAGIGLHRGEVVLGSIGSETRRDFTVIGDAVNTASRLEGLTKELASSVLLSAAVHAGLTDRSGVEPVGEVTIRGRKDPLAVYRLRDTDRRPSDASGLQRTNADSGPARPL